MYVRRQRPLKRHLHPIKPEESTRSLLPGGDIDPAEQPCAGLLKRNRRVGEAQMIGRRLPVLRLREAGVHDPRRQPGVLEVHAPDEVVQGRLGDTVRPHEDLGAARVHVGQLPRIG